MSTAVQTAPIHRLVRAALSATAATTLISLNSGMLVALIWMALGLLIGGMFAATGLSTAKEWLLFLGGYNALVALGCLSTSLAGITHGHISGLSIAALATAVVIIGALIRWRFRRQA